MKRERESLFLDEALHSRRDNYSSVVQPISNLPWMIIFFIFIAMSVLVAFIFNFEIEDRFTASGIVLLKNKPTTINSTESGIVSDVISQEGDLLVSDDTLLIVKKTICETNESTDSCLKPVKVNVGGYLERFNKTVGDTLKEGDLLGIVIPESLDVKFELYIPINQIEHFEKGEMLFIDKLIKSNPDTRLIESQIKYVSKLPTKFSSNGQSEDVFIVMAEPKEQIHFTVASQILTSKTVGKKTLSQLIFSR